MNWNKPIAKTILLAFCVLTLLPGQEGNKIFDNWDALNSFEASADNNKSGKKPEWLGISHSQEERGILESLNEIMKKVSLTVSSTISSEIDSVFLRDNFIRIDTTNIFTTDEISDHSIGKVRIVSQARSVMKEKVNKQGIVEESDEFSSTVTLYFENQRVIETSDYMKDVPDAEDGLIDSPSMELHDKDLFEQCMRYLRSVGFQFTNWTIKETSEQGVYCTIDREKIQNLYRSNLPAETTGDYAEATITSGLGNNPNEVSQKEGPLTAGSGEKKVIVFGYGDSPAFALNHAFRSAVEEGVGVLLQSSTMVENDELLKDKVYTYSKGFIRDFKKLAAPIKQDGEWVVQIAAIVVTEQIEELLVKAGVKIDFPGKSIFAQAMSHENRKEDEAKFAYAYFDQFDFSRYFSFDVSVVGYEGEGDTRIVLLEVNISLDPGYFRQMMNFLIEIGEQDVSWSVPPIWPELPSVMASRDLGRAVRKSERAKYAFLRDEPGFLGTEYRKIGFKTRANSVGIKFLNPKTVAYFANGFFNGLKEPPFMLEFLDQDGNALRTESVLWGANNKVWDGLKYVNRNSMVAEADRALFTYLAVYSMVDDNYWAGQSSESMGGSNLVKMYRQRQGEGIVNCLILVEPENTYYGKAILNIEMPLKILGQIVNIAVKQK